MRVALIFIALCLYDIGAALRNGIGKSGGAEIMPKLVGWAFLVALILAIFGDMKELFSQ